MLKRTFFVVCYLLIALNTFSQKQAKHEAFVSKDNDFFVPKINSDKNYSFGLFVGFRIKRDSSKVFLFSKRASNYIHHIKFGLMGYTPDHKLENFDPYNPNDRPFAGWLFAEYQQIYIYQKAYFMTGFQIGTLGENAHADKVQNEFHKLAGFNYVKGWDSQIPNLIGFNILGTYENIIVQKQNRFLFYKGDAIFGNTFSRIDSRIGLALGKRPTLFNFSRLASNQAKNSLFIKFDAGIKYTFYDATIEGNRFGARKFLTDQQFDKSTGITSFGIHYLSKGWSLSFEGFYETEVVNNSGSHRYGRVTFLFAL